MLSLLIKKYLILTIAFFVLFIFNATAQKGSLKGPRAKNMKPWEDQRSSSKVMVSTERALLKGPEAKNRKPWENDREMVPVVLAEPRNMKGPRAKNTPVYSDPKA